MTAAEWVVLAGLGFIAYVLAGYPLLLDLNAIVRGRRVAKRFEPRTVTVLLPVRDGERWIARKLDSLAALDYPVELLDVIVLDDGSRDGTAAAVEQWRGTLRVALVRLEPGGKARALTEGIARATGEILFFTDVRQPLDAACLRELVACFGDREVGVASGELVIRDGATHEEANVGLYWLYEKWIRRRLSAVDSVLGATGAVYAMRRALARRLPPGTLLDDIYLPLGAFFRGYRVVFDESAVAYDEPATLDVEFRRKVRTLAGVYQVIGEYPELLGWRNRMWIHFVSHKVARLLLPFALIAVAVASFWLEGGVREVMLGGQAAAYGLAAIDGWVGERSRLKRLTSPARTFVVLMAAALCAVSIWFVPAEKLWAPARR